MDIFGHKISPKYNGVTGGASAPPFDFPPNVLLTHPNDFSLWTFGGSALPDTLTKSVTDYLGTPNNAWLWGFNSGSVFTNCFDNTAAIQHFAIMAKATATAGFLGIEPTAGNGAWSVFNLNAGTIEETGGFPVSAASIRSAGNGWYECRVDFASAAGKAPNVRMGTNLTTAKAQAAMTAPVALNFGPAAAW